MIGFAQRRSRHARASWYSWYDGVQGPDLVPPDTRNDKVHTTARLLDFGSGSPQMEPRSSASSRGSVLVKLGGMIDDHHEGDDREDDTLPIDVVYPLKVIFDFEMVDSWPRLVVVGTMLPVWGLPLCLLGMLLCCMSAACRTARITKPS